MLNLVLFGGPGSGKGTQSARLMDDFGLFHISTGELLRDHINRGTELGKLADSYISKGNLIPDDLMISIIEHTLDEEAQGKRGVIFDGFPRTLTQARSLDEMLKKRGSDIHAVVGLEVPDEELIKRILHRGEDSGRSDDNLEAARQRIDVYHNQTQPIRDYYKAQNKYIPINGEHKVEDVYKSIRNGVVEKTGRIPNKDEI